MTTQYDYDNSYEPAAPVVLIGLSSSGETTARQEVAGLLDSGADATMIPVDVLTAAGARYVEQRQMRGVVGEAVAVNLYLAAVHIGEHIVRGIRAIGMPIGSEAIVGRDVLNQLEITLKGPAQETWIS
jgi:predicted aspartyl protease